MVTTRRTALLLVGAATLSLPLAVAAEKQRMSLRDRGIWHLTAPAEMTKTESVVSQDDGYENQQCTRGLAYGDDKLRLFSTNTAALKTTRTVEALDHFLVTGERVDAPNLLDILCSDAAISNIASLGTVESNLFDRQQLFLADISQDDCGDTVVMSVAKKGSHYFVLTAGLKSILASCTCVDDDDAPTHTEEDCSRRFACLRAFFAKSEHVSELQGKWSHLLAPLHFGD